MASSANSARGLCGEECAARYLQREGWWIRNRNYRAGRTEIDIIAQKAGILAFVEVKARADGSFAAPSCAVTIAKRTRIVACAWRYLQQYPDTQSLQPRFDVAEVIISRRDPPKALRIRYLPGAFTLDDLKREERF